MTEQKTWAVKKTLQESGNHSVSHLLKKQHLLIRSKQAGTKQGEINPQQAKIKKKKTSWKRKEMFMVTRRGWYSGSWITNVRVKLELIFPTKEEEATGLRATHGRENVEVRRRTVHPKAVEFLGRKQTICWEERMLSAGCRGLEGGGGVGLSRDRLCRAGTIVHSPGAHLKIVPRTDTVGVLITRQLNLKKMKGNAILKTCMS